MRLSVGVAAVVLACSGCDWMERSDPAPVDTARARLQQARTACASKLTYARLKEYVFDEAARIRNSDPSRLDSLAAASVVRMEDPVVKSRDGDLNITVCTGRFVLNLPPGVQDAFDGRSLIEADVEYAAQAAVDGSGLVYSMNGAEPIIYRLATLGLPARPLPNVAAAPAPSVAIERPPATASADSGLERPLSPPHPPVTAARRQPETQPQLAARSEQASGRRPAPSAKPSFNCGYARTRSEKMVCGSGSLAAADRQMSAAYYNEMAGAGANAKRALRQSRDRFLARRERCPNEACVARVYAERVAEIRSIAAR